MTTRIDRAIYLHGFASSPRSSKATFFKRELEARGVAFSCPDFNAPEFETLTVTRMLDQTRASVSDATVPARIALVGSSLGAFVAIHASTHPWASSVDRLVLLAPGLDFGGNRLRQLGEHGIDEWRRRGTIPFFHYAFNEPRDVGFALYEDAARYDAFAVTLDRPTLVFQGLRDASVDPAMVDRWARDQPNVTLKMLDDDHQLTASIQTIWTDVAVFLGLD